MIKTEKIAQKNNLSSNKATEHLLQITNYTDPLCCWSWAFQPELEKLQQALGDYASWETRMGGLIPSWNNYHDETNSVSRPVQMGPVWMHAGQIANRKINHLLWIKDPPASSYPACVAVKSAQLQSAAFGERILSLLRNAAMVNGENIAKPEAIDRLAIQLSETDKEFDLKKFRAHFNGPEGMDALREDLQQVQYYRINRFPSLLIAAGDKKSMLSGYRPYAELVKQLTVVYPELEELLDRSADT